MTEAPDLSFCARADHNEHHQMVMPMAEFQGQLSDLPGYARFERCSPTSGRFGLHRYVPFTCLKYIHGYLYTYVYIYT